MCLKKRKGEKPPPGEVITIIGCRTLANLVVRQRTARSQATATAGTTN